MGGGVGGEGTNTFLGYLPRGSRSPTRSSEIRLPEYRNNCRRLPGSSMGGDINEELGGRRKKKKSVNSDREVLFPNKSEKGIQKRGAKGWKQTCISGCI